MPQAVYRVINSTVKPPRLDANGKDLRDALEKVGHPVHFFDSGTSDKDGREVTLHVGKDCIVHQLTAGLLGLQRGGYVRIEQLKDISEALKAHAYDPEKATSRQKPAASTKASASQMDQSKPVERMVNPDGKPNFVVDPKAGSRRTRRGKHADADGQRQPATAGEG